MSRRPNRPINNDDEFNNNHGNDGPDQDLINAITKGDLISIGPAKNSPTNMKEEVSAAEFEIPYFLYNNPIGIDFSKDIAPGLFLLSGYLLDRLCETPYLSQEYRYFIENLKNQLIQGKIAEFIHSLLDVIKKNFPKGFAMPNTMDALILQACINVNGFILNIKAVSDNKYKNTADSESTDSIIKPKWISQDQLLDFLKNPEDMKTKIKEFRSVCNFTANQFSLSYYLRILLDRIISHLPPEEKAEFWLSLRKSLNNEDLISFSTNLAPRITHHLTVSDDKLVVNSKAKEKVSKSSAAPNDPICWDIIVILAYFFQDYVKALNMN